ncbi:MAG: PEP-CTERM sorting domain-containing protein [Limisphaerales bacterium]
MNRLRYNLDGLALLVASGLAMSAVSGHAQSASATIFDVAVAGGYDYTITLNNTGSISLEDFWYGWTQDGNNLPSDPSSLGSSLGWSGSLFGGNSVEWQGSSGTALAPGNSATFTFFSASTPTAMTTPPAGESVAYVNGIDFSQNTPGDSTAVFSPTLVATPEPSSIALLAIGSLGLLAVGRRRLCAQS